VPWLAVLGTLACVLVGYLPASREFAPLAATYQLGLALFR
jgi:hypothetical protein